MELIHLKGSTYYIKADVNIGLFKLSEDQCILIDSGLSGKYAEDLIDFLRDMKVEVKAVINTHSHRDHMGGNSLLIKEFNSKIYASRYEDTFIERPDLGSMFVHPSAPFNSFRNVQIGGSRVDYVIGLDEDKVRICEKDFAIVELAGHSPNQIGVLTEDDVFFAADAYVCKSELDKMKILYSYDLSKDLECKKRMLDMNHSFYVPSHGEAKEDIRTDIEDNILYYENLIRVVLGFLSRPKSLDELMQDTIRSLGITTRLSSYMIGRGCLSGIISHMERSGIIRAFVSEDVLKFDRINN